MANVTVPSFVRLPASFIGISFNGAAVPFTGGMVPAPMDAWSFDDSFDLSFG